MKPFSNRIALGFAQIGHTYTHLLTLLYPTVVLAIEPEFGMSYGELLLLMTLGNLLFGLGSPAAGWLGDKWSTPGMMVLFFVGMGLGCIATGAASSPFGLTGGLALLGLAASIYHPVGMAWLVRNAENRGRALGVNGVFGSVGFASAGLLAGWLTELINWRAAFFIPGAVSVATGLGLLVLWRLGWIGEARVDRKPEPPPQRDAVIRAFIVLSVTMLCTGLIYHAFAAGMPKLFAEHIPAVTGGTPAGAGTLVSLVFFAAMAAQLAGGHLADKFSLKRSYVLIYFVQVPLLLITAGLSGVPLFAVLGSAVLLATLSVPVENSLLAKFSPANWRGTLFGVKFLLSAGVSAAAVPLVALVRDRSGDFYWLFILLAAFSAIAALAALALPREEPDAVTPVAAGGKA